MGMGGMPGEGAGGMPSFPGMPPMPGQAAAPGDPYAYLWRIVHAVFALGLGLYIAFTTPFTGTKIARERSGLGFAGGDDVVISPSSVHFCRSLGRDIWHLLRDIQGFGQQSVGMLWCV